jgi:uncharacterized protein (DUF1697 family)
VTKYVALLRGANVGGITVKSADLADMARGLGLDDVRTVLASGNLTFSSRAKAATLKSKIERGLRDRFGYDAWIVLTTADHLRDVIDAYPFPERDAYQPYVVFGSDGSVLDEIEKLAGDLDAADERVDPGDKVLYWECPKGSTLDMPFSKLIAKPKYKSTTTTRNLRTLRKLV